MVFQYSNKSQFAEWIVIRWIETKDMNMTINVEKIAPKR